MARRSKAQKESVARAQADSAVARQQTDMDNSTDGLSHTTGDAVELGGQTPPHGAPVGFDRESIMMHLDAMQTEIARCQDELANCHVHLDNFHTAMLSERTATSEIIRLLRQTRIAMEQERDHALEELESLRRRCRVSTLHRKLRDQRGRISRGKKTNGELRKRLHAARKELGDLRSSVSRK